MPPPSAETLLGHRQPWGNTKKMGTSCQGESPAGGSWVRGTGLLPSSGLGTGDRGHCRQPSTTTREPAAGVACSQGLSLRKTKCPHLWRGSGPSASGPWASGASLTDDTPPLHWGPGRGRCPSLHTGIFWTELQKEKRTTALKRRRWSGQNPVAEPGGTGTGVAEGARCPESGLATAFPKDPRIIASDISKRFLPAATEAFKTHTRKISCGGPTWKIPE